MGNWIIFLNYLPDQKVAVSLVLTNNNIKLAQIAVNDFKGKEIEVTLKENKSQRSIEQNSMLWAIIETISLKLHGNRNDENLWKIYEDILIKSNIKRELVAVLPEALHILQKNLYFPPCFIIPFILWAAISRYFFKMY